MSDNSHIQWTEATWNFLVGCTKTSAGCMYCYAIRVAWRLMHNPNRKIARKFAGTVKRDSKGQLNWTGRINFDEDTLKLPLGWKLPRRIFVNSLSDLFHPNVKDEWIDAAFAIMALCRQHTFQILTKHPERAAQYFSDLDELLPRIADAAGTLLDGDWIHGEGKHHRGRIEQLISACYGVDHDFDGNELQVPLLDLPLPNVQLLTSVEDQPTADERIPWLLKIPAAARGISAEPLLGPVNLDGYLRCRSCGYTRIDQDIHLDHRLCGKSLDVLDWVIVGGESGPGARSMNVEWMRSIVEQCKEARVPVFVKQLGAVPFEPSRFKLTGDAGLNLKNKKGGDISEFPGDLQVREFPTVEAVA